MKIVFLATASPLLHFFLHLSYQRVITPFRLPASQQKVVALLGLLTSLICVAVAVLMSTQDAQSTVWNGLYVGIASLGFCHFYFHLFNLSETARRIHILRTYYVAQKEGRKAKPDLSQYSPTVMIRLRIERLLSAGVLRLENGVFFTPPSLLLIAAKIIQAYRRLF